MAEVVAHVDEKLLPNRLLGSDIFMRHMASVALAKAAEDYTVDDIALILRYLGLDGMER